MAMALHSKDGKNWIHGVRAPNEFSSCNSQGCILWDGAIVELYHDKPVYYAVPAQEKLTPVWAEAKNVLFSVGASLTCAESETVEIPIARVPKNRPSSGSIDPFLIQSLPFPADCLSCPLKPFPLSKNLLTEAPVTVIQPGGKQRTISMPGLKSSPEIEYVVRKNGSTERVRVRHAPNKQIEAAVAENVQSWVLVPPRANGTPVIDIRKRKIAVSCQAFPSNGEALCTLRPM